MGYNFHDIRRTIPKHPTRKWKYRASADTIVVHCTAGSQQDPNKVAANHIQPGPQNHLSSKGAPGIAYHDFVRDDGVIFHCNSYNDSTWHARSYNDRSIGIVMAYRGLDDVPPPDVQLLALCKHLVTLCFYIKILPKRVLGHRELPWMSTLLGNGSIRYKKACPGMAVDMDKLRDMVTRGLQKRLKDEGLYGGAIDGIFGPKSQAALRDFDPRQTVGYKLAKALRH